MFRDGNEIKEILTNYSELYESVDIIVQLHGEFEDCYYEIENIEYHESCLIVGVEFYKWQDTNHKNISIELELLTNKDSYQKFLNEMNIKITNNKFIKEHIKKKEKKEAEILKAIQLLKDNGIESL